MKGGCLRIINQPLTATAYSEGHLDLRDGASGESQWDGKMGHRATVGSSEAVTLCPNVMCAHAFGCQ